MTDKRYNGEILRGHIENSEMNAFLDSYIKSSNRSLLINGDGARGKTACLTAWAPTEAKKILINCASDEAYSDWTAIVLSILKELCAYVSDEESNEICSLLDQFDAIYNNRKLFDEKQRELFRVAAFSHLNSPRLANKVVVVINDLNLLSDDVLSRLPAKGNEKINYICSTNDDEMAENADIIGWNVKKMPLFSSERARSMVNDSLRVYGKNLSPSQFEALMSSIASRYPGQLRFVISFLLNHGRFDNLDRLTADISAIATVHGIYRYIYDFLTADLSVREKIAACEIFGLLRASKIALSESDCYELAQRSGRITSIEWARICRVFEQFDLIHGDYWYVRDEEVKKFVDELISPDDMRGVNELLAAHLHGKICDKVENAESANSREIFAYAKQMILCLRAARNYGLLRLVLCDERIISSLINYEQSVLRSAWLELFLNTDIDLSAELSALVKRVSEVSQPLALEVCKMINAADMTEAHQKACEAIGVDENDAVGDNLWSHSFSEFGIGLYQKLHLLHKKRQYREMLDTTNEAFASDAERLNEAELCKVYFFKCDALVHLGLYENALSAANEYYNLLLKAGCADDMRGALSMRANVLYRQGRISEVSSIVLQMGNIALRNGKVRDYLSTLNMRAMCCLEDSQFDESIELFDKLFLYWKKLGEKAPVCTTAINKSNALYLSDRVEEAVGLAEKVYDSIKNDIDLLSCAVSLCGNIGFYSLQLKDYEKAEKYLCYAMEMSKKLGIETTLSNTYDLLGNLYKETDSLGKRIELYSEQMEFLWSRREFDKVMNAYEKALEWLSTSNHKNQARALRDKWRERLSEIQGGLGYFEQSRDRQIADEVNVERLKEKAKLAASERDWRGEAEVYRKIAEEYENDDPKLAAEYLYRAATNYMFLGDRDSRIEALAIALRVLFKEGQIVDIFTCDNIVLLADDEDFEEIARLWRELGDLAYAVRLYDEGRIYIENRNAPHIKAAVDELLLMRDKNEYLVVSCIIDMAEFFAKELPEDMLESVISAISDDYRQDVIDRFDSVMSDNMNVDLNYLMNNYFGNCGYDLIKF